MLQFPWIHYSYDHDVYNRGFSQGIQSSLDTISQSSGKIRKDLVDQRVVEGHIVPHRLVFTSHAPTSEYQTVAWLPKANGIKVNISLQVTWIQSSIMIVLNHRFNYVYQKIYIPLPFYESILGCYRKGRINKWRDRWQRSSYWI